MPPMFECTLPFPPSVNSLFGGGSNQKRFPSAKYKDWIRSCPDLKSLNLSQILHIVYTFTFPDKRKRDLSNLTKAPEDFLVNQRVIEDDHWGIVGKITLQHIGIDKNNPNVRIQIYPIDSEACNGL